MVNLEVWKELREELDAVNVTLIAVSKTKPIEDIQTLYDAGQRDFGENYVQELTEKQTVLPGDIRWHFIGHLQSNKVKYIAPFVHMVHAVDNSKLLAEINKHAAKNNRIIDVLLQVYIAKEESKFGLDEAELMEVLVQAKDMNNIRIRGLMGMATNTDDASIIKREFTGLKRVFDNLKTEYFQNATFDTISMGMSGDYKLAIEAGSTMVRIGSMLFGKRQYST